MIAGLDDLAMSRSIRGRVEYPQLSFSFWREPDGTGVAINHPPAILRPRGRQNRRRRAGRWSGQKAKTKKDFVASVISFYECTFDSSGASLQSVMT
jgi:hypothetical protein